MAGTKRIESLNADAINSLIGVQKAISTLADKGICKIVLIGDNGLAIQVTPNEIKDSKTDKHFCKDISGEFDQVILVKKNQSVEIENGQITVDSSVETSLIDSIINTVRDKTSDVWPELSFSMKAKIFIGKKDSINELIPKVSTPKEFVTTVLPDITKKFEVVQPKGSEVTGIDQPFQMLVLGGYNEMDGNGDLVFKDNKKLLLIDVIPQKTSNTTHVIEIKKLKFTGEVEGRLGDVKAFFWQLSDSGITPDQLLAFNG